MINPPQSVLIIGVCRGPIALPRADEGTAAHLFQILMCGQLPIIAFFALRWLPRDLRAAVQILALQITVALIPMATLFFFEH